MVALTFFLHLWPPKWPPVSPGHTPELPGLQLGGALCLPACPPTSSRLVEPDQDLLEPLSPWGPLSSATGTRT